MNLLSEREDQDDARARELVKFTLPADLDALVADGAGVPAMVEGFRRPDWLPPAVVTAQQRAAAAVAVRNLEARLAPADRRWIAARAVTLLAHFWMPDLGERVAKQVGRDWQDALGEFAGWAIDEACRWWVRAETHRPTPAAIRERCYDAVSRERRMLARLRTLAEPRTAIEDGRRR